VAAESEDGDALKENRVVARFETAVYSEANLTAM
jgi:hypothetical protein